MQILAHDENSLTNLVFSELHRLGMIHDLLSAIRWRSGREFPVSVKGVDLHQQLNLSQFGKPDAILLVTDAHNRSHLLIIEAKLGFYRDAYARPLAERHFNNALNSKLNNQLTLRYRGMRSLPSLERSFYLHEEPHDAISPYCSDISRQCKKSQTLTFMNKIRSQLDSF